MSAHNTPYHMYNGPLRIPDPGDGGTIAIDRYGAFVDLYASATGQTRTLAVPEKVGIIGTVAIRGSGTNRITLTVTGGYNYVGDTEIQLQGPGDCVIVESVLSGDNLRWRVVGHEGTSARHTLSRHYELFADEIKWLEEETTEHGAGAIGTAFAPRTYRYTRDQTIITEIQIDLTGLDSSGTENDVIGLATGGAAYIGRNVVATNGVIYKVEMSCLEVPTAGDADIILVQGSAADEEFDDTVANTATICDGTGDWLLGETIVNNSPQLTSNYYYYLTQGSTDDNTYTAGQYLIRFYGHAPFTA